MGARKLDLNQLVNEEGVRTDVTIKSAEDADEKRLRLRKEFASFWIKDVGPFLFAIAFLTAMAIYCIASLARASTSATERDLAWKALTLILGVVLGTVFGKATAK